MKAKFTQSFKIQAVEKALRRSESTSINKVAQSIGIPASTLHTWIGHFRSGKYGSSTEEQPFSISDMTKEKRPQDWAFEEKLQLIIDCSNLDDDGISELCRNQGIYPHHVKQWKDDFASGAEEVSPAKGRSDLKILKQENKRLKKELHRKERALAETAALLVLQKKVNDIWGSDEEDLL